MGRSAKIASGIGERIASLYEGKERSDFAKEINIPDNTIGNYVRGERKPNWEFLQAVHDKLDVDINWLITGTVVDAKIARDTFSKMQILSAKSEAEMEPIIKKLQEVSNNTSNVFEVSQNLSIPHYDIKVNAGSGVTEFIPNQERYVSFDENWFNQFVPAGAVLGMIDVNGDSMSPTIRSGDCIIVNMNKQHTQLALAEGGIFVFTIRGDFKVKRLQPMANGDLRIISDNDKYETETIPAELLAEDIHIQAVVLKRIGDP